MMIELVAAATWFCFPGNPICYDTSRVDVKPPSIATVITEIGMPEAILVVDCTTRQYTVYLGKDGLSGLADDNSPAAQICSKHMHVE